MATLPDFEQLRSIALSDAFAQIPTPDGQRSALLFRHGTLQIKMYAPRGFDPQTPHRQDEVYVIAQGSGYFVHGDTRVPFRPGDVLFAAAGEDHRFVDFSEDFYTWVFFYGPDGGEGPTR